MALCFVCASLFQMWLLFCHCLFLVSPSFGTPGKLCFVIVAFFEYLHIYICSPRHRHYVIAVRL